MRTDLLPLRVCLFTLAVAGPGWVAQAQENSPAPQLIPATAEVAPQKVTATYVAPQVALAQVATQNSLAREIQARRFGLRVRVDHLHRTPPRRNSLQPQQVAQRLQATVLPAQVPVAEAGADQQSPQVTELPPEVTGGNLTTDCEPSAAVSIRGEIFCTGNFFAAHSASKDAPLQKIDILKTLKNPQNAPGHWPFFCDQVALYDATNDLMVWYLQYYPGEQSNTIRLVVAQGPQNIPDLNKWQYYDFTPAVLGGWTNEWFDFPELALGKDYLYISSNTFQSQGSPDHNHDPFGRAVVFRLPLQALASGGTVKATVFSSQGSFSLRPTHGARAGTMYFAGHDFANYGHQIEVYSWSEASTDAVPERQAFAVDPWPVPPEGQRGYASTCRDGNQWLLKADPRMTAGWCAGGQIGFAWTVDSSAPSLPNPNVRVALLALDNDKRKPTGVAAQPHVWSAQFAFAYPAAGVTPDGKVGLAVCYGGGGRDTGKSPGVAVGLYNRTAMNSQSPWQISSAREGDRGPTIGVWGDYLSVRPAGQGSAFIATGFFLRGGGGVENVVPCVIRFGPGAGTSPPPPGGVDIRQIRQQADKLKTDAEQLLRLIDQLQPPAPPAPAPASSRPNGSSR